MNLADAPVANDDEGARHDAARAGIEQARVGDDEISLRLFWQNEARSERDRCQVSRCEIQTIKFSRCAQHSRLTVRQQRKLLLIVSAPINRPRRAAVRGLHHHAVNAVIGLYEGPGLAVAAPSDVVFVRRRARDARHLHGVELNAIKVAAAIVPRIEKNIFGIGRERERPLVPVLGVGQLFSFAAGRDLEEVRVILRTFDDEEDFAAFRVISDLADLGFGVINRRRVAGSKITYHQIRAARQLVGVGDEATVGRPCRVRVPAEAVAELLGVAALRRQQPDFAEDGDGQLCAVGRHRRVLRTVIDDDAARLLRRRICGDWRAGEKTCKQ